MKERSLQRSPFAARWGWAIVALSLVHALPAQASKPPLIEISPPACQQSVFPLVPFLDALRVELAGRGRSCCTLVEPEAEPATASSLRVKIEIAPCTAETEDVQIAAVDQTSRREEARTISLVDVAESARPRALALAVAELIRSLGQADPDAPAPPAPPPPPPPIPPPHAPVKAAPSPRWSVRAAGEARVLPNRDTIAWGGRVGISWPWRMLHADLDLGGEWASAKVERGEVNLRRATVGVGLGPRLSSAVATIDLGLRADVGWAWIRGKADDAGVRRETGSDLVSTLGIRACAEAPSSNRLRASFALEVGGVVRGITGEANRQSVIGLTGYYLLASLGIAVTP
jgi:hypothetical protein